MRVKAIYRKNLKMSTGKVAAHVAHAVVGLGVSNPFHSIVVLKVSDKKFDEAVKTHDCFVQIDLGYTEVGAETPTAAAWVER